MPLLTGLPFLCSESELVVSATSSSSTRRASNFSKLATTFLPFCLSSYFKFRPLPCDSLSTKLGALTKHESLRRALHDRPDALDWTPVRVRARACVCVCVCVRLRAGLLSGVSPFTENRDEETAAGADRQRERERRRQRIERERERERERGRVVEGEGNWP